MPKFIYDIIPPGVRRGVAIASQEVSKWIRFLRIFLKTSKYGSLLLVIAIICFGALLVFAFYPKTEIVEIFPTQYGVEIWSEEMTSESQELNWQNGEKALQRDLGEKTTLAEFSSENSVILFEEIEESPLDETSYPTGQVSSESEDLDEIIEETASGSEDLADEKLATDSEAMEEIIEESEVAGIATESDPEGNLPHPSDLQSGTNEEILEETIEESEDEEIPEGVGGCEFCDEEELASDAEDLLNLLEEVEEKASISQPSLTSYSIIFSGFDFNSSISFDSFKKAKLMFSWASEKGNQEDVLLVEYRIIKEEMSSESISEDLIDEEVATESESVIEDIQSDSITAEELIDEEISTISEPETDETESNLEDLSEWKTLKLIKLDKEQSNFINNGYWQEEILDINFWEDLSNMEVRFTFQGIDSENRLPVYLDAVWFSIEYSKPEGEEERKNLEDEYELELLSDKLDFKIDEDLEFKFHFRKKQKKNILGLIFAGKNRDTDIKIEFLGRDAELLNKINPQIQHQEDGKFTVSLNKLNLYKLRPGKYKMRIRIENTEGIFVGGQEFTLGVLAINTNKSIYLPSERAYLQMATLDDFGHTICNANLALEVTDPDGEIISLNIQRSGKCGPDNVVDVPDYFAYYQVEGAGVYEMKLTNLDNGYEITDSFEVRGFVPFDIERIGPTRIYPLAIYEMVIKIKIKQDFDGRIVETVPASFETKFQELRLKKATWEEFVIFNQGILPQEKGNIDKRLIWQDILLEQGDELELRYMFDAPDISPYLYLLGPLRLDSGQALMFEEARQWQIASDAETLELWVNAFDNADCGNWTTAGDSPYLGVQDGTNYVYSTNRNANCGNYTFQTTADLGSINSVYLYIYAYGPASNDFTSILSSTDTGLGPPTSWGWVNVEVSTTLDTWDKINAASLLFDRPNTQGDAGVDAAYLLVNYEPVANNAPTMAQVSVYGTGVTSVTITEDSAIDIMATVSISDIQGCTDIRDGGGVEAIFYTTDNHWTFGTGTTPSLDYNQILDDTVTSCSYQSCSGDTATYECYASNSWYYYADPTVGSTASKAEEEWAVMVWASDSYDAYVSSSSMDVAAGASNSAELTLVSAIALETGSQSVGYDNNTDDTDSAIEERGMRNSGNRGINPQIRQTTALTFSGNTISAQSQLFASSSFSFPWDSDAYGVSLSTSYQELDLDLPQRTDDNDEVDDQIFWGLHVPLNTFPGNYAGENTYTAVPD